MGPLHDGQVNLGRIRISYSYLIMSKWQMNKNLFQVSTVSCSNLISFPRFLHKQRPCRGAGWPSISFHPLMPHLQIPQIILHAKPMSQPCLLLPCCCRHPCRRDTLQLKPLCRWKTLLLLNLSLASLLKIDEQSIFLRASSDTMYLDNTRIQKSRV